jgi:hypothetical protein
MLVVVGGHTRDVGKTSVLSGLICTLPQWEWTALKVTQYGHGMCASNGDPCGCAPTEPEQLEHPYVLTEEEMPTNTDTGRYLAAGAVRSFWLRTAQGQLEGAVPILRKMMAACGNVIVESNSILEFFQPDLYLVVMDFSKEDFKPSSLRYLDRADALIVIDSGINVPMWEEVSRGLWEGKPQFVVKPPYYVTMEIAEFVRARLSAASGKAGSGKTPAQGGAVRGA